MLEYPFLAELIAQCDAVLHLAAIVSVPRSLKQPVLSFQINTQGFLHVLQAVYKSGRFIPIVHASSAAVYGGQTTICRDDIDLSHQALSPYALQKIHAEDYGRLYQQLYGIKSIALRYFNVYGPRQDASSPYSGVISRFLAAYQGNEAITIFGDGLQTRDFIHVSDVARANWLALQSQCAGPFNIATGESHTLLQAIDYINKINRQPLNITFMKAREGDIIHSSASIQKAETELGFKFLLPIQDGIQQMINV